MRKRTIQPFDELQAAGLASPGELEALGDGWERWCDDLATAEPHWKDDVCQQEWVGTGGACAPHAKMPDLRWRDSLIRLGVAIGVAVAASVAVWVVHVPGRDVARGRPQRDDRQEEALRVVDSKPSSVRSSTGVDTAPIAKVRPSRSMEGVERLMWDDPVDTRLDAALLRAGALVRPVSAEDRYFERFERAVRRLAAEVEQSSL